MDNGQLEYKHTNTPSFIVFFVINLIFAPLGVQPPEAFLVVLSLLQEVYILLPVINSIAIMRNPEMRKAIKMLKKRGIAQI